MTKNKTAFDMVSAAKVQLDTFKVAGKFDGGKIASYAKGQAATRNAADAKLHAAMVAAIHVSLPEAEGGNMNGEAARQLVNSMRRSARVKTAVAWFEAFSNIVLKLNKAKTEYAVKMVPPSHTMYKVADPAGALAMPFWEAIERETSAADFDLGKAIEALIAKASKASDNGKLSEADAGNVLVLADFVKAKGLIKQPA